MAKGALPLAGLMEMAGRVRTEADLLALEAAVDGDLRQGAARALDKGRRQWVWWKKEMERLAQMGLYEREWAHLGPVCGIDEVGRGPLAGPVVAAAVILPPEYTLPYLDDSKKVPEARRRELDALIRRDALDFSICRIEAEEIDCINILQATIKAMKGALAGLELQPAALLIDALELPGQSVAQRAIIGGDGKSYSIAAASILAKVARDAWMEEYAVAYPGYGFERHKGYGTAEHRAALARLGPCPLHRRSFLGRL